MLIFFANKHHETLERTKYQQQHTAHAWAPFQDSFFSVAAARSRWARLLFVGVGVLVVAFRALEVLVLRVPVHLRPGLLDPAALAERPGARLVLAAASGFFVVSSVRAI